MKTFQALCVALLVFGQAYPGTETGNEPRPTVPLQKLADHRDGRQPTEESALHRDSRQLNGALAMLLSAHRDG